MPEAKDMTAPDQLGPDGNEPARNLAGEPPDAARRRAALRWVMRVGAIGAAIAAGANLLALFVTGAWQMGVVIAGQVLAIIILGFASRLIRRNRFDAAGYWTLFSLGLALGIAELVHAGATVYLLGGGLLLMFTVGNLVLPRKWPVWLVGILLFAGYVGLVNWLAPLPRYDLTQIAGVNLVAPGVLLLLLAAAGWWFLRAYRGLATIRTRLLISFVLMAVLLAGVISGGAILAGFRAAERQVQSHLESVSVLKEAEIDRWTDTLQTDLLLSLAGEEAVRNARTLLWGSPNPAYLKSAYDALQSQLRQVIRETKHFDELFLINLEGQVVLSTDSVQEGATSHANQEYFRQGLKGPYVSRPFYSLPINRTSIAVSRPVVDPQGQALGVLAGHANLATLDQIMTERAGLGSTGDTYLVTPLYVSLTANRFGQKTQYVRTLGAQRAIADQSSGSDVYDNYRGERVYGAYRWLPRLQTALLAEQTQWEALGPVFISLGLAGVLSVLAAALAAGVSLLLTRSIANPLANLARVAAQIAAGDLDQTAPVQQADEVGALARAFNSMTAQLRGLISSLEQRVADRTRDLERRSAYLEAAAQVSHAAASILEPEQLIRQVVELIRQRFDLYYVGLFLVDESGEWAVLRAGTGEAGQALLARGHRRRANEGLVGWSITHGQARVALDVGADAVRLATAELPHTRSEAALPLRSRSQVLGALTVQSDQPAAFDPETIVVLQTMADQVAVALDNARLLAESQAALESTHRAYGELSRQAWAALLRARPDVGVLSTERGVTPTTEPWRPEMRQAWQERRTIVANGSPTPERRSLAVPIKVRDQLIGVVDTYKPGPTGDWSAEEVALLETLTEQLGLALDGARLYQDSQRRAARERLTGEITARMRQSLDVDTVLKTATDELFSALGLNEVVIRLATREPAPLVGITASLPLLPGRQRCAGRDAAHGITLAVEEAHYQAGDFMVRLDIRANSGPEDDLWQPELEAANARRAVADPETLIYLGPTQSSASQISLPILNQGGLAQIGINATYPGLTKPGFAPGEPACYYPSGRRTFFRLVATDELQGAAGAWWASDLALPRVYILEQDDAYGHALAHAFRQTAAPAGLAIVGASVVGEGQTTGLETIVAAVAACQPDLIYYAGLETTGVGLIRAIQSRGLAVSWMGGDGLYAPALIEQLGPQAEGIMATFPSVPTADLGAEGQNFARRFQKRFGYPPSEWAVLAYEGARIALAAIAQARQADRAAVIQALRELEFPGLAGRYRFDENGDLQRPLISGLYVKDGVWQSGGLLRVR